MNRTALRAVLVTAAAYAYFLLFAQFAFVELLRGQLAGHDAEAFEKKALGLMALLGIASGFWAAWKGTSPRKIRTGLLLGAAAAGLAPWVSGLPGLIGIAMATGVAVGMSTVSLATMLRSWCSLVHVGIGTGIAYACCNLPCVFSQAPARQASIAAVFALIGAVCVPAKAGDSCEPKVRVMPFSLAVLLFTALVWLDSAAFFIIQHASDLKQGTWGETLLWRNAAIHLIAAAVAGLWLLRGPARLLPAIAWGILAAAAMAVNHDSTRMLAGWLYPLAVSLYSAALVAWPGWFSGAANSRDTAWKAAWLFAVAGWFGSANGIGMAQSLHRVPHEFIVISGVFVAGVMLFPAMKHWRSLATILSVGLVAFWPRTQAAHSATTAVERGRQVYLSEGCIHCHSQFVRPATRDDEYWGPSHSNMAESKPVLIGNRRQGPDLSTLGARRSATWLKQHFINPQLFSPGSIMPNYASLFVSGKGDDLAAYLLQLGTADVPAILSKASTWQPAAKLASSLNGKELFSRQCALCHGSDGTGNGVIAPRLNKAPANLVKGPFIWSPESADRELKIQRIIKYGIFGTDMPGHETLSDEQVIALAKFVLNLRS
jgi:cbb3-type cytochrome oxidase cytochrome c subunit